MDTEHKTPVTPDPATASSAGGRSPELRFLLPEQPTSIKTIFGGAGLTHVQSHLITASDACNPGTRSDFGASGPCRTGGATAVGGAVTGIPNPNHRQSIDLPGRRFSVDDTLLVDLWLSGVVMF